MDFFDSRVLFTISIVITYLLLTLPLLYVLVERPSIINPKNNYKEWKQINWFGVILFTLIFDIAILPYIILYGIFKLFYWIFTVGRETKEEYYGEILDKNGRPLLWI